MENNKKREIFTRIKLKETGTVQNGHYEIRDTKEGILFESFFQRKKSSDQLLVFLNGAFSQETYPLPHYQRWSYAEHLDINVLSINDSLLYQLNKMMTAWYAGDEQIDYAPIYAQHFLRIAIGKPFKSYGS